MRIGSNHDYQHPVIKQKGQFVCKIGQIVYEYSCGIIKAPIAELEYCTWSIPVVVHGNLDFRVISTHPDHPPCQLLYLVIVLTLRKYGFFLYHRGSFR